MTPADVFAIWLGIWVFSTAYALHVWRKRFDVCGADAIFIAVFCAIAGPLVGSIWWICFWDMSRDRPCPVRKPRRPRVPRIIFHRY